jgi:hypothetical protein
LYGLAAWREVYSSKQVHKGVQMELDQLKGRRVRAVEVSPWGDLFLLDEQYFLDYLTQRFLKYNEAILVLSKV